MSFFGSSNKNIAKGHATGSQGAPGGLLGAFGDDMTGLLGDQIIQHPLGLLGQHLMDLTGSTPPTWGMPGREMPPIDPSLIPNPVQAPMPNIQDVPIPGMPPRQPQPPTPQDMAALAEQMRRAGLLRPDQLVKQYYKTGGR